MKTNACLGPECVGARGSGHCAQLSVIEGVQVVAIRDLVEDRANG